MKERGRCVIWDRIFFMLKRTPTLNSPPFWMGRIKTWSGRSWNGWFSFFDSLCRSRFFLFPRLYRELCCCTAQPPEVRLEKEQKSKRREREPRGSGTELIRQGQHQEFVITPQWSRESRLFRFQSWTIGCEEDLPTDVFPVSARKTSEKDRDTDFSRRLTRNDNNKSDVSVRMSTNEFLQWKKRLRCRTTIVNRAKKARGEIVKEMKSCLIPIWWWRKLWETTKNNDVCFCRRELLLRIDLLWKRRGYNMSNETISFWD